MKSPRLCCCLLLLSLLAPLAAGAAEEPLTVFLRSFNYAARDEMRTGSRQAIELLEDGKAVLVDVRFKEEQQAWATGFGLKIPLNELPDRLKELPKDKLVITACPHKDRAIIAMLYLRSQGFQARYLSDTLPDQAESLRGTVAGDFIELLQQPTF